MCDVTRRAEPGLVEFSGPTMGTVYTVKVVGPPAGVTAEALQQRVETILADINRTLSTYDPESELSRFNDNQSTAWVAVSLNLCRIIREAQAISPLTGGAFDVTIGPVVNLWGFGPPMTADRLPSDEAVAAALARVGYPHLHTRDSPPALRKDRADLYIDVSAIAQGFAADRLAEYLESLGVGHYLVDTSGELRVKGRNAQGQLWRIAIEKPSPGERAAERIIPLTDTGIVTSGNYRNFFDLDGQRYSHIMDPKTGRPVRHELASVTVIDPSATFADAMATALLVLGPEQGFRLAEEQGLAAFFIAIHGDEFVETHTSAFNRYLQAQQVKP